MDSNYLKEHLLDYVQLICGIENKSSCFCEVQNERFVFGYVDSKGRQQVSRVTKQIAITLSMQLHEYVFYQMCKEMPTNKKEVKIKSGLIIKRTK